MPAHDQGFLSGRYALIPRTLIFLIKGEQILLLKGSPHKRLWANRYNGIGGHVERGEDILTSARRELKEETGIECSDLWLCGTITVDTDEEVGVGIFVFRCQVRPDEIETNIASPDGTLEWVDMSEVLMLPLVEDLPELLPRVIQARRGDSAFAAHYSYDGSGKLEISFGA